MDSQDVCLIKLSERLIEKRKPLPECGPDDPLLRHSEHDEYHSSCVSWRVQESDCLDMFGPFLVGFSGVEIVSCWGSN